MRGAPESILRFALANLPKFQLSCLFRHPENSRGDDNGAAQKRLSEGQSVASGFRAGDLERLPIGAAGCSQESMENERGSELVPIRGIRLRRAVMGTLLVAERPLCIAEIVEQLAANGMTTMPHLTRTPNRVVADLDRKSTRLNSSH